MIVSPVIYVSEHHHHHHKQQQHKQTTGDGCCCARMTHNHQTTSINSKGTSNKRWLLLCMKVCMTHDYDSQTTKHRYNLACASLGGAGMVWGMISEDEEPEDRVGLEPPPRSESVLQGEGVRLKVGGCLDKKGCGVGWCIVR